MPWLSADGFCDGRFWGELDVRSTSEAGFCRFWTRGAPFAGAAQLEVLSGRPLPFVALLTTQFILTKLCLGWLLDAS